MLRTLVTGLRALCLVEAFLAPALAVQLPLSYLTRLRDPAEGEYRLHGNEEWNFDALPNPNATDRLVFETVYSLLQHWPNTRMRNGHNIVPGSIPKGTLLYHGTWLNEIPRGADWVATDPEHAYIFCQNMPGQRGCWQLTLATTRELKILYFDGNSAAKIPFGTMDTQDLLAWGKLGGIKDHKYEIWRLEDLCEWGKKFDVDGFVRMEVDFEVMLCDISSGVTVVSFLNLMHHEVPQAKTLESDSITFQAVYGGSLHNRFPGESRIRLDLAGLVSFYDTELVPSLVDIRAGQERWDHRIRNISSADLSAAKSKLEEILAKPTIQSSGIDWMTLIQVIVDRYAGRLELTHYLLNSPVSHPDEVIDLANKIQSQLRIMLMPYLPLSAKPIKQTKDDLDWAIPIYELCATTHTRSMDSEMGSMTSSEKLLLRAVRGTTREICRVVTKMWAAGVYAGVDRSLNTKESLDVAELSRLSNTWTDELNRLMGWLDWGVWVECNPSCAPDEMCYLPTWPFGFPLFSTPLPPPPPHRRPPPEDLASSHSRSMVTENRFSVEMSNVIEPDPHAWIRPQPECIKRVHPYNQYS